MRCHYYYISYLPSLYYYSTLDSVLLTLCFGSFGYFLLLKQMSELWNAAPSGGECDLSQGQPSEWFWKDRRWKLCYVIPSCQSSDSCSASCDVLSWKTGNTDEYIQLQLFDSKGNKKEFITVEHDRHYPSSVDYLCPMSLLYWCIVFLLQGNSKTIKFKVAFTSFPDCLNNVCLRFCVLNCRFKTSVSKVLKVLSLWGGDARW